MKLCVAGRGQIEERNTGRPLAVDHRHKMLYIWVRNYGTKPACDAFLVWLTFSQLFHVKAIAEWNMDPKSEMRYLLLKFEQITHF